MLDKHEKWLHFAAALGACGMSFAADLLGVTLSSDTVWLLRAFAGGATLLGGYKAVAGRKADQGSSV